MQITNCILLGVSENALTVEKAKLLAMPLLIVIFVMFL